MRKRLALAAFLTAAANVAATALAQAPGPPRPGAAGPEARTAERPLLDNARVRAWRATTAKALAGHPAAVVVVLEDGATRKAGDVYWSGSLGAAPGAAEDLGSFLIVEPKPSTPDAAAAARPSAAATPPPVFVGMNFTPVLDNERVRVSRARMDVGAKEGLHTHGADLVVVYLSDGEVEDTANGTTKVDHWKRGDVEFEALGSSHSTRNLGPAIDAVIVGLKP